MGRTNTVVVPAPWSFCAFIVGGMIVSVIAGVLGAWYLLPIDWIAVVALTLLFGRPWGQRHVRPIYERARAENRPKPYVRLTFPWRQPGC